MRHIISQRVPFIIGSILILLGSLLYILASLGLISWFFLIISILACLPIGLLLVIIGVENRGKGLILLVIGIIISIFSIYLLVISIVYIDLLIALIIIFILLWTGFFILPGLVLILKEEVGSLYFYLCLFIVVFIFWFLVIMGMGASITQTEYRIFFFQNILLVSFICFIISNLHIGFAMLFKGVS